MAGYASTSKLIGDRKVGTKHNFKRVYLIGVGESAIANKELPIKDEGKTMTAETEPLFDAKSLTEFVDVVSEISKHWFPDQKNWGPWFRGHSNSEWRLAPKLYRNIEPDRGIRVVEDEIRQEFLMRGPSLGSERPQNSWDWYFLGCSIPGHQLDCWIGPKLR